MKISISWLLINCSKYPKKIKIKVLGHKSSKIIGRTGLVYKFTTISVNPHYKEKAIKTFTPLIFQDINE